MKDILKAVFEKLTADSALITLLGYNEENRNIRRFESLKDYDFEKMLLFGRLTGRKIDGLNTFKIRDYDMQIQVLNRVNDIEADDIREKIIEILHDTKLEVSESMRSLRCEVDTVLPVYYDETIKMYVAFVRFALIITKLN